MPAAQAERAEMNEISSIEQAAAQIQNAETMPHSIEAEQQLLGAILTNNDVFDRVAAIIKAEHFYDPVHSRIYDIASSRIAKNALASPVTSSLTGSAASAANPAPAARAAALSPSMAFKADFIKFGRIQAPGWAGIVNVRGSSSLRSSSPAFRKPPRKAPSRSRLLYRPAVNTPFAFPIPTGRRSLELAASAPKRRKQGRSGLCASKTRRASGSRASAPKLSSHNTSFIRGVGPSGSRNGGCRQLSNRRFVVGKPRRIFAPTLSRKGAGSRFGCGRPCFRRFSGSRAAASGGRGASRSSRIGMTSHDGG